LVDVVFDEHVRCGKSGGGNSREMDFESFLDFVLALENKDTPEGLTYLFKCLDLHGRGYLTTADVHTLFRYSIFVLERGLTLCKIAHTNNPTLKTGKKVPSFMFVTYILRVACSRSIHSTSN